MISCFLFQEFSEKHGKLREKLGGSHPGNLKDYSPWLASFQADKYADPIEIPGKNYCLGSLDVKMGVIGYCRLD